MKCVRLDALVNHHTGSDDKGAPCGLAASSRSQKDALYKDTSAQFPQAVSNFFWSIRHTWVTGNRQNDG